MVSSGANRIASSTCTRCLTRLARFWEIIPAPDETLWWLTDPAISAGSHPHDMGVNSTGDAVLHLGVQLGQSVPIIDAGFLNISNSSLLHNVPHKKSLDCLVLRAALAAVGAANEFDVATAVLVAATVPALESHR